MQTVVIVNLNGIAYHLEESAFEALGAYLQRAEQQLRDNPDRAEIVGDLEQAIADKCSRFLGPHKTVVTAAEMATILEEMGPVHDQPDPANGTAAQSAEAGASETQGADAAAEGGSRGGAGTGARKRLYAMPDTGFISGVCSGLAVFFDVDVTLLRIGLTLAALAELIFLHTPVLVLAYLTAICVVPSADTSEERAAARGLPFNAQQLIDEAKRNFARIGEHDWRHTRREWRKQRRWERKYERQMRRTWSRSWTWPAPSATTYGSQLAAGFVTPVLTLISVCAFWLMAYAVLSLANTGAVHGWRLPADVPLWLGLLGVVFVYSAVMWPLHAARRASYYRLGGPDHARYEAFDGLMSTILGVALVWAAYRYSPEIREWLRHFPDAWHNVVASFRA